MAPAGDRFDSDCVVGTQFESSQVHHAVLRKQRFPAMIRRKLHAVHQQLALVERTEIGRKRIAKVDGAEQFIVDGIGDGLRQCTV
jgi:hypothetical protein